MSSFTGVDCGSLSVGDIVSLTDERNGQTYRIKKMQDNKCWMVDNMKYLGEGITISNVDGTEGIILNDTDGKYNTVDVEYTPQFSCAVFCVFSRSAFSFAVKRGAASIDFSKSF